MTMADAKDHLKVQQKVSLTSWHLATNEPLKLAPIILTPLVIRNKD